MNQHLSTTTMLVINVLNNPKHCKPYQRNRQKRPHFTNTKKRNTQCKSYRKSNSCNSIGQTTINLTAEIYLIKKKCISFFLWVIYIFYIYAFSPLRPIPNTANTLKRNLLYLYFTAKVAILIEKRNKKKKKHTKKRLNRASFS